MFFGARHFWRGIVIWLGFGPRTPRVFSPVAFSFRGSGVFFALSLSPSSSPPPLFWRPARVLFLPFLCVLLQDTGPTSGTWSGRSCIHVAMSALSPLSARVGRPPPLFLPPSAFSLSLFFSLSPCKHVYRSVSQQDCKWLPKTAMLFAVLQRTWITVENLGLIHATCLTFGE